MTDKEIIRAEIERLKSQLVRGACAAGIAMETNCKEEAYNEVLAFIDSLPAESPDFEAEWKRYTASRKDDMRTNAVTMNVKEVAKHFAEWQKGQDDELLVIAHFDGVQSGKEAERKEMMKAAVEGYVEISYSDDTALINCPFKCNTGDKVKLIILKEDD